jgi:hypothetical protein
MFDLNLLATNPELARNITITVSGADLLAFARSLKEILSEQTDKSVSEEIIPAEKLAEILNVSSVTLWSWDKKDILKPFYIGNRKFYRRSDIQELINEKQ